MSVTWTPTTPLPIGQVNELEKFAGVYYAIGPGPSPGYIWQLQRSVDLVAWSDIKPAPAVMSIGSNGLSSIAKSSTALFVVGGSFGSFGVGRTYDESTWVFRTGSDVPGSATNGGCVGAYGALVVYTARIPGDAGFVGRYSTDEGTTWANTTIPSTVYILNSQIVGYAGVAFTGFSSTIGELLLLTTNGTAWTIVDLPGPYYTVVKNNDSLWVGAGTDASNNIQVGTSSDLMSWTTQAQLTSPPFTVDYVYLTCSNGVFLLGVVSNDPPYNTVYYTSERGTVWSGPLALGTLLPLSGLAPFGAAGFYALGFVGGTSATSPANTGTYLRDPFWINDVNCVEA